MDNSPQENEVEQNQPTQKAPLRRPVRNFQKPEEKKKKERITLWMGAALILTALSIDGFQAVLNFLLVGEVFSTVISVGADMLFIVWFWSLGLGFVKNPRTFAAMGIQEIIGLIPIANTLPELTLGILAIVLMTRAEDKGGALGKLASTAQGKPKL